MKFTKDCVAWLFSLEGKLGDVFLLCWKRCINDTRFLFFSCTEIGGDVFETSSKRGFNVGKFVVCQSR